MDSALRHERPSQTLAGHYYYSPDIFEIERERAFAAGWVCVGREEHLLEPGSYLTIELVGEPVFVVRGRDDSLRAFANTCRHRGTRLLEGEGIARSVIQCPYHAWTYGFDGSLLGAPNVHEEDGLDRTQYGLWGLQLEVHDGFIFVNIDETAKPLVEKMRSMADSPLELERYAVGDLRVGGRRSYDVHANWKILVENYHECLHCPSVHPELVKIVPLYRRGEVEEDGQSLGNSMGDGLTSFTMNGLSSLPPLPGLDEIDVHTFYGTYLFPNLLLNYHSDTVNAVYLYPEGPERTRVISEFLFRPETIEAETFDPDEVVEFRDLVAKQDWSVCERAQQGVRSRFYTHGVYPRQENDVYSFNQDYLAALGGDATAGAN